MKKPQKTSPTSLYRLQATSKDNVFVVDAFDENVKVVKDMEFILQLHLDTIPRGAILGVEATKELADIVDEMYGISGYCSH